MGEFYLPLLLTTIGGLATGVGSLASLFFRDTKRSTLSVLMGFAAGTMIYISFAELLEESIEYTGFLRANLAFFAGIFTMMLLDHFIPHAYLAEKVLPRDKKAPEDHPKTEAEEKEAEEKREVLSAGLMTAIGIGLHNFPEGMIVFISALHDIRLGIALTVAIALHNIPEGFSIGMPIFYATASKNKTLLYSLAAGLTEPVGALIFALLFGTFLTPFFVNIALGFVAGVMVFISFDELLPLSFRTANSHSVVTGLVAGMLVMFVTLIFV